MWHPVPKSHTNKKKSSCFKLITAAPPIDYNNLGGGRLWMRRMACRYDEEWVVRITIYKHSLAGAMKPSHWNAMRHIETLSFFTVSLIIIQSFLGLPSSFPLLLALSISASAHAQLHCSIRVGKHRPGGKGKGLWERGQLVYSTNLQYVRGWVKEISR